MSTKKIFIPALVLICFIAAACTDKPSPHIYIALGDSVSSGYGLAGYPALPQGSHPSIFFEKLKIQGFVDEYHNMGVSGFTTTMLLEMLNTMNDDQLKLFRNARIITLNIGGNNILTPFLEYLSDLQIVSGAGSIITGTTEVLSGAWGIVAEIMSAAGGVIADTPIPDLSVGGLITGLGGIVSGIGGVITRTEEVIAAADEVISGRFGVTSIWRGSFSPELEAMLEEGVQTFEQEFTEIITWLKTNAPNAALIVNTVHNPIPQEILRVSVPLFYWANALIESMNYIILAESVTRGYTVVDVHYHFLNRLYLTAFNLNPFTGDLSLDIVHPNAEGHNLIAALHYAAFAK